MRASIPEITKCKLLDKHVFIVSDLHLAGGRDFIGNYSGTENFLADSLFSRFLERVRLESPSGKGVLIINGDFVDFLRIVDVPKTENDFEGWQSKLQIVGIDMSLERLKASVNNDNEREFGLRTNDYKSIWKLMVCSRGHSEVFGSLSTWVSEGNQLIIIKGNHDLEWHWPAVGCFFRTVVLGGDQRIARNDFTGPVSFVEDVLLINESIYIEHGHRYENITFAEGTPVLEGKDELRLSVGSFFNRYLLNKIELSYPYVDNIRPQSNVLPMLLKERFPLAIKVLCYYVPLAVKMIPKKEIVHALRYLGQFIAIVFIPAVITGYAIYSYGHELDFQMTNLPGMVKSLLTVSKNLAFLALSYLFGRLLAFVQLAPPGSLFSKAKKIFGNRPAVKLVSFGHTHDPEQSEEGGRMYFNTGTWMPVYQLDAADVRLDLTYSFLCIQIDSKGDLSHQKLLRWNDDSGRIEPIGLTARK